MSGRSWLRFHTTETAVVDKPAEEEDHGHAQLEGVPHRTPPALMDRGCFVWCRADSSAAQKGLTAEQSVLILTSETAELRNRLSKIKTAAYLIIESSTDVVRIAGQRCTQESVTQTVATSWPGSEDVSENTKGFRQ